MNTTSVIPPEVWESLDFVSQPQHGSGTTSGVGVLRGGKRGGRERREEINPTDPVSATDV